VAFKFDERTENPLAMYLADIFTVPASLAGIPAVSLPCGFAQGLPVGLQLQGRSFEESTLLRIGGGYQRATQHHLARPNL
jgi:aspartyl-tRNA(Asn)/glutamyl-tRNA(Gln) amidotransferase subunit A